MSIFARTLLMLLDLHIVYPNHGTTLLLCINEDAVFDRQYGDSALKKYKKTCTVRLVPGYFYLRCWSAFGTTLRG